MGTKYIDGSLDIGGTVTVHEDISLPGDVHVDGALAVEGILKNGRTFYNVASLAAHTDALKEIVIKTKIPFLNSNIMPLIHLKGYSYSEGSPIDLSVVFYIFKDGFSEARALSAGGCKHAVFLSTYTENEQEYVAVSLDVTNVYTYFPRFAVDFTDLWQDEDGRAEYDQGWTIETSLNTDADSIIPSDRKVEVQYIPIASDISGKAAAAERAAKAIADDNGNNIVNTYETKAGANAKYLSWRQGAVDLDTEYNAAITMVRGGQHYPSGSPYGTGITLPYRTFINNTEPDYAAQIFFPNGDDASRPDSLFYRTSTAHAWRPWQEVITNNTITNYMKEANLQWGGRNISGAVSPIDAAMSDAHRANRLAFSDPKGITVEYSRDGGATYTPYETEDGNNAKIDLVSGIGYSYAIGGRSGGNSIDDKLRVTLNAIDMGVYCWAKKLLLYVTSSTNTASVTIEEATVAAPDTWITVGTYPVSGWSGWNSIPLLRVFGTNGADSTQKHLLRLTFGITALNADASFAFTLSKILLLADTAWNTPSEMARTGHLYGYNASQRAIFPADVQAVTFHGALNGKASSAAAADALFDTSMNTGFMKGSATQPVYFDNGVPVACSYSIAASVPADAKFTDTIFTGGNVSKHIYLTGAKENDNTANTSQLVFGTSDNNHVAISSNKGALIVNPSTSSYDSQIILSLTAASTFPRGIVPKVTNNASLGSSAMKWASVHATTFYGNLAGTAQSAEIAQCDGEGNEIHTTYQKKNRTSIQLTKNADGTYAVNWSDIEGREVYLAIEYPADAGDRVCFASSIIVIHTQAYENVDDKPCDFDGSLFTIEQNMQKVLRQPRITRVSNSEDICTLSFTTSDHVKDSLVNAEVHMYYQ